MSFAAETGYIPATISDLMNLVRIGVNTSFSQSYDADTFVGSNFYKYFYALIQRLQENEVRTSEIVLKLQQYFAVTNEFITRPNTTNPGVVDFFKAAGYMVSVKAPIDADAGKAYICVNVDSGASDYAIKKLALCKMVSQCVVAGVISQGTEVQAITLSNDQSFDFKYSLPNKIPILLKLTLTTSANNQFNILSVAEITQKLFDNINARYRLGLSFEPQRYFSVIDAPWAAVVLLQYSLDSGGTWVSSVATLAFDDLYTFAPTDITIVEV